MNRVRSLPGRHYRRRFRGHPPSEETQASMISNSCHSFILPVYSTLRLYTASAIVWGCSYLSMSCNATPVLLSTSLVMQSFFFISFSLQRMPRAWSLILATKLVCKDNHSFQPPSLSLYHPSWHL